MGFYHRVMCAKDVDQMVNSVVPDQSDLGLLFAQTCLSEYSHYCLIWIVAIKIFL